MDVGGRAASGTSRRGCTPYIYVLRPLDQFRFAQLFKFVPDEFIDTEKRSSGNKEIVVP
jgi:hypothetical protein